MTTNTWENSGSASWTTSSDWSLGTYPGQNSDTTDDVVIDQGQPTITGNVGTANSVTIGGGGSLDFEVGQLAVTTTFNNSGEVYFDSSSGSGGSTLTVGGELTNNGTIFITPTGDNDIVTAGSVDDTSNQSELYLDGSSGAVAELEVTSAASLDGDPGDGVLVGDVQLSGDSLIDFASGQISEIAADSSLELTGNSAFVASGGATTSNSALQGPLTIEGDATLDLESGANLTLSALTVNEGFLDLDYNGGAGLSELTVSGTLRNVGTVTNGQVTSSGGIVIGDPNGALSSNDVVNAGSVDNGGLITLFGGASATASLTISGELTGDGIVNLHGNGVLSLGSADGLGTIDFQSNADPNQIIVTGGGALADTVENFQHGDTIDFTTVTYQTGDKAVYLDGVEHIETASGQTVASFAVAADYGPYNVENDGSNGIIVSIPCFWRGTLIRTPDGETPVETLRRGDPVLTMSGEAKPVTWIGRRTVSARFADPLRCWPVRIRAGALAENVPARDLLVSPDHALLVGRVLIHAGALVNGTSIVRETHVPKTFVYYHVELEDHSLILAEDTPAETFIDNVDRMDFDNWAEFEALYPEGKSVEEMPYPRVKGSRQVPMGIRAALDFRAKETGAAQNAAA